MTKVRVETGSHLSLYDPQCGVPIARIGYPTALLGSALAAGKRVLINPGWNKARAGTEFVRDGRSRVGTNGGGIGHLQAKIVGAIT